MEYKKYAKKLCGDRWYQMAMAIPSGGHRGYAVWARESEMLNVRGIDGGMLRALYAEISDDMGKDHVTDIDAMWYMRSLNHGGQWVPLAFRRDLREAIEPHQDVLGVSIPCLGAREPDAWTDLRTWSEERESEMECFGALQCGHGQVVEFLGDLVRRDTEPCRDHIQARCGAFIDDDMPVKKLLFAGAFTMQGYDGLSPWVPSRKMRHILSIVFSWEAQTR